MPQKDVMPIGATKDWIKPQQINKTSKMNEILANLFVFR